MSLLLGLVLQWVEEVLQCESLFSSFHLAYVAQPVPAFRAILCQIRIREAF